MAPIGGQGFQTIKATFDTDSYSILAWQKTVSLWKKGLSSIWMYQSSNFV